MKHTPAKHFEIPVAVLARYENSFAVFEYCENNVLVVRFDDDFVFDLTHAKAYMEEVKKFAMHHPISTLSFMGLHTSSDEAARTYFAQPEHRALIASSAVVIASVSQRLIGNFFLRFSKTHVPLRFFNHPHEAWAYLLEKSLAY